jgi:ADP-ribosylglycohydrolase
MSGGNGTAMRNICIGLAFYSESDLDILIDFSIQSSQITHNSPLGFLAGFTSAYFASLAVREIELNKWVFMMLELLESDKIKKYIGKSFDEQNDYNSYIRYWKKYIDTRFNGTKPIKTRSTSNMMFRIKYYYENFVKDSYADYTGSSGFCAMIMAYDALIDCDGKFEKLVYYSILNPGDSDTIGSIACGLYGIVYGFGDVPKNLLCCIETKDKLLKLGEKFYKKFYKK